MYPYKLVDEMRVQNPLVHNITNIVVANDSANGLLAIGASPFMSSAVPEMAEVAGIADVVVLNMGTLNEEQIEAMEIAGTTARKLGKPVVFDPVGIGATSFRKTAGIRLIEMIKPTLIRGNAGEIATLAEADWSAKGVDAGSGEGDVVAMAKTVAKKYHTFVVVSGVEDVITDGEKTYLVKNGTSYFPSMTGAGCLHSCVCGAYLALTEKPVIEQVVVASAMYALAGELVADMLPVLAVGSFRNNLLDQLSQMDTLSVQENSRIEKVD
ncbi:hydroxyethylthiazole kinase [Enterococcus sp. JM4C]|uniref:hydroxyethylthiazole kinase n=1 Tax=Candidatus Enterococcus huntleyi TaxID=1857217 RepID=UPI0013799ACB|nr:hydroxyethylthiazole kinase [Enterococcus sp. JM4C]KAF1298840.1 hydroxyethylthiazole kinase [Enterococcus sp. JM4C]